MTIVSVVGPMNTARIVTLKLAKRLRHRREKYLSFLYTPKPTTQLPHGQQDSAHTQHGAPVIFFHPSELEARAHTAQALSSQASRATIDAAERICDGELEIFGQAIDITHEIAWHTDWATGRTWPKIPAPQIQLVYHTDTSDIKAPWELARFQFLPTLARAWAYTGQERFPWQARELIESFWAENPFGMGIHWANPMEAAIRAANWIVTMPFFDDAPGWDSALVRRLRLSCYDHGRFVRTHLERDGCGINNNHYTADLAGLFMIGLFLSNLPECRAWSEYALHELDAEIGRQIAPDGMHYENSFGYHRLTFEMFFFTHRLALLNGFNHVRQWEPALQKMAEFMLAVTMPNGEVPNFGDNDDGVWLGGSARPAADHRDLVSLSAAAFGHPDPAAIRPAMDEVAQDITWYLGVDSAHRVLTQLSTDKISRPAKTQPLRFTGEPIGRSHMFAASGIVVMRSDDGYVLVSANPVGTGGIGGHKHNDLLSYVFTVDDFEVVVDPGTYAYTAEPALRNHLRGTAAHNTVMVDGAEQNRLFRRQLFWVRDDAFPRVGRWEATPAVDRVIVQHDGYRRLPGKVIHTREFVFEKHANILVIRDELAGDDVHEILSVTNFGEGTLLAEDRQCVKLVQRGAARRAGFYFATTLPWQCRIEPCWHSVRYRHKRAAYRMVQQCRAQLPIHWVTAIGVFAGEEVNWQLLKQAAALHPAKPAGAPELTAAMPRDPVWVS